MFLLLPQMWELEEGTLVFQPGVFVMLGETPSLLSQVLNEGKFVW